MRISRPVLLTFALLLLAPALAGAREAAEPSSPPITSLTVKGMSFRQFAAMISQATGQKVIVSLQAGNMPIHLYLERVTAEEALEAACRAYQCWYKKDEQTGIVCVVTLDEYKQGMSLQEKELVQTITLKYQDPRAVGDTLQRLFRDRIIWQRPDEDENDGIEQIELALERMDLLGERVQFSLEDRNSGSNSRSTSNRSRSRGRNSGGSVSTLMENVELDLSSEALLEKLIQANMAGDEPIHRPGVIYISVLTSVNCLLVRTTDGEAMRTIRKIVTDLDMPRPQVLLEVKVLELTLEKDMESGIDWLFSGGSNTLLSGGRSVGLSDDTSGSDYGTILLPDSNLVPQGTGLNPQATVLQFVSDSVRARLQLLEARGDVKSLATPSLCVAHGEASRIFVGSNTTVLNSVEKAQTTTSGDNPVVTETTNVDTERHSIGTSLLITPLIHSDRSVTIRIVQEDSQLGSITDIYYDEDASFQSQDIVTRSVTSTVLANDREISAVGGLIREDMEDTVSGIPGLMDLPWIGSLFRTTKKSRVRSELIVLLRPCILRAPGEADEVATEFLGRLSAHPSARPGVPELGIFKKSDARAVDNAPSVRDRRSNRELGVAE